MITLVTGASGHVGNNLVRSLLAQGRQVRVLIHRNTASMDSLGVEKARGDVCDAESLDSAFAGVDVVYHLAAMVSIGRDRWAKLHSVNTTGTANVVDACLKNNVRRLIHFSSIDALEQKPVNLTVNEKSPPAQGKKHPPYDRSKAAGEAIVRAAAESRGLDAIIINPTAVIGPYDYQPSHQGQMLVSMACGKLPALVKGGFDWVDVRDVVYGAMQAEIMAKSGSKYILGGHWASLTELARIVEMATGTPAPAFTCPLWLASASAPLITAFEHLRGRRSLYTRASIIAINSNHHISHEKAEKELNYHPVPLAQTINDALDWFAEYGKLPRISK
jgi:dihydroflavonol-4-reductase